MGFLELLTIVFVILKAVGVLDWSWLTVFLPEIVSVGIWILFAIISLVAASKTKREFDREFDKALHRHWR